MADDEEIIEEGGEDDDEIAKATALFSPEGIVMMGAAITLDFIGFVLTVIWLLTVLGVATLEIPEIVNWASDGAGFAFFGTWLLFRAPFRETEGTETAALTEDVVQKRRSAKRTRVRMGRGLRFGIAFLGEVITVVGALPFWTWFVYSELKS